MRMILPTIVALLSLAALAHGQDAATQPADSISALIAQLSDPVFGVREKAEQMLEAMGPTIAGELRDAERTNLPDETRARIEHILARFEEQQALHASVTLHYEKAPMLTVLNDFAGQAGGRLGIDEPLVVKFAQGRKVSVDLDEADFWQAMRVVTRATGLATCIGVNGVAFSPFPGRAGLPVNLSNRYAVTKGGLLIMPLGLQDLRRIDYGTGQTTEVMSLPVGVYAEPKMHIVGMMDPNWLKVCVDDKGNSLISKIPERRFFPGFVVQRGMRQWSWMLQANLHQMPDMGTQIAQLKGELNFSAQTRGTTLEIDDITNPQTPPARDGMTTITALSCSKIGINYHLTVRFTGVTPNSPEYLDFVDTAQLFDDQGRAVLRQNYLPPHPFPGGMDVEVVFQPTDFSATKLQWERTLEEKKFSVPFEIDGLPLPGAK
jgi:hypothetical protein